MSARIEKLMAALDREGYDAEQLVMNYLVDAIAPEAGIEWDDDQDAWVTV